MPLERRLENGKPLLRSRRGDANPGRLPRQRASTSGSRLSVGGPSSANSCCVLSQEVFIFANEVKRQDANGVIYQAEVLFGSPYGKIQILFLHEHPQTLHRAFYAGFDLYRQHLVAELNYIIYLCIRILYFTVPIVQPIFRQCRTSLLPCLQWVFYHILSQPAIAKCRKSDPVLGKGFGEASG